MAPFQTFAVTIVHLFLLPIVPSLTCIPSVLTRSNNLHGRSNFVVNYTIPCLCSAALLVYDCIVLLCFLLGVLGLSDVVKYPLNIKTQHICHSTLCGCTLCNRSILCELPAVEYQVACSAPWAFVLIWIRAAQSCLRSINCLYNGFSSMLFVFT